MLVGPMLSQDFVYYLGYAFGIGLTILYVIWILGVS